MSDTIFDKILKKEIPAKIVFEDEDVMAFHDVNPQAPVHVLVIPKKKCTSFANLGPMDDEYVGRYFKKASEIAESMGLNSTGYRIIINNGKHGQQSVDYIHIHILGGRQLSWPPG